jgi:hypothetical protein
VNESLLSGVQYLEEKGGRKKRGSKRTEFEKQIKNDVEENMEE